MDAVTPDTPIEITDLHKQFRDFWRRPTVHAVAGISLAVRRGEVYGLLGPNGSGKSTTIKMLLGLLHPTSGTVRVLGRPPGDVAAKSRIGYLPEVSYLHTFLTPVETLRYYAGLFGLDAATAAERTRQLLAMVGLEAAGNRQVGSFSKGMARRVGFAQALINNPELIVLDEPTSGLDPIACREVKDLVGSLAAAGKTILMTSHLLADVQDVCHRIAILCNGRLQAEGRVADLLVQPDVMRYTVACVDREEAERLRGRIEAAAGRPVRAERPTVDLESFFLKVVAEAAPDATPQRHFHPAPFLGADAAAPQPDRPAP